MWFLDLSDDDRQNSDPGPWEPREDADSAHRGRPGPQISAAWRAVSCWPGWQGHKDVSASWKTEKKSRTNVSGPPQALDFIFR